MIASIQSLPASRQFSFTIQRPPNGRERPAARVGGGDGPPPARWPWAPVVVRPGRILAAAPEAIRRRCAGGARRSDGAVVLAGTGRAPPPGPHRHRGPAAGWAA